MSLKFLIVPIIVTLLVIQSVPESMCFDRGFYIVHNRLRASMHLLNGEHVSLEFYKVLEDAANAKADFQNLLHNFLENLQRNLTTSVVLKSSINAVEMEKAQWKLTKLKNHLVFFETASNMAEEFAKNAEHFFQISKNQSNDLLLKLRQVPSAERSLPIQVKVHLTLYFAEMEFFHVMFSEVIDEALEYIVDTLRQTHLTLNQYADIQSGILFYWNFKPDEWCCNQYMEFLQKWSAHVYKCAADTTLSALYDVYAMTEMTIKHIIWQLKFRIQRLYNCFLFGEYEIRCGFLHNAEQDFEKLFAKLEELQIYLDIKTKRGRVSVNRDHRYRRQGNDEESNNVGLKNKCIPYGFPENQMLSSLKSCFNLPELN